MEQCICDFYPGFNCATHTFWPAEPESTLEAIYSSFQKRPKVISEFSKKGDSDINMFPLNYLPLVGNIAEASLFDNSDITFGSSGKKKIWMRELTLTQPAKMRDPYDLRAAMSKIIHSKMFGVIDYIYCIELTKEGTPHVHALLVCNKEYVNASKVKQFWPHRYELKSVVNLQAYIKYIFKEKSNPLVISYCQSKGIPQYVYKESCTEEQE